MLKTYLTTHSGTYVFCPYRAFGSVCPSALSIDGERTVTFGKGSTDKSSWIGG